MLQQILWSKCQGKNTIFIDKLSEDKNVNKIGPFWMRHFDQFFNEYDNSFLDYGTGTVPVPRYYFPFFRDFFMKIFF